MKRPSYHATMEAVIAQPLPVATATYKPVANKEIIECTLDALSSVGFLIKDSQYTLSANGRVASGIYNIKNIRDEEMSLKIAWQNSYDKSASLKFAIGAHVFICSNGCVHGDMGAYRKKHMGNVQSVTPTVIESYIKDSADVFSLLQEDRDWMKTQEIDLTTTSELVGRLFLEEELITSMQLNIIKRELRDPSFDYGVENTLWNLYQHVTHSYKSTLNPSNWIPTHIRAHEFFTSFKEAKDVPVEDQLALDLYGVNNSEESITGTFTNDLG